MRTFVISDLHFDHKRIIEYEHRPFDDVESMNESIIARWNNVVARDDHVFVLGDVCFCGAQRASELINRLHGHKTLVMGNHDFGRSNKTWIECGFSDVSKYPIIVNNFFVMSHEPPTYFNDESPFFFLYGHVHGDELYSTVTKNTACVCVERWNYTPIELEYIIKLSKQF